MRGVQQRFVYDSRREIGGNIKEVIDLAKLHYTFQTKPLLLCALTSLFDSLQECEYARYTEIYKRPNYQIRSNSCIAYSL